MTNLLNELSAKTFFHYERCEGYRRYIRSVFPDVPRLKTIKTIEELPWIPVRAFKLFDLKSIPDSEVFKVMHSSGTTGKPSKIFLDRINSRNQQAELIENFASNFGKIRLPMLIIDSSQTVSDRRRFSARTAAINGFSIFARRQEFALDPDMNLQLDRVLEFCEENKNEPFFVFGFTFLIWKNFIRALEETGIQIDCSNAFILHGGGWKKLENEKVSNAEFKEKIYKTLGCDRVHNYYGLVEQTGTIYLECSNGNLHAPKNADFIVRSQRNLEPVLEGEEGLIQVMSSIQTSYPGHSILTEDIGSYYAPEFCNCGSSGRVLVLNGRASRAEIRGCSDAAT